MPSLPKRHNVSPKARRLSHQPSPIRLPEQLLRRHRNPTGLWTYCLLHSARMKWVLVIVLAIIGVLAAIVAIEYFVVPIHSLPSFIPGHHATAGHYRKRGAVAALIAVVALVAAGVLAIRFRREDAAPATASASASTADQLLGKPPATPEAPPN